MFKRLLCTHTYSVIKTLKKSILLLALCLFFQTFFVKPARANAQSMPFYDLKPSTIVTRSVFSTDYSTSTQERKTNVQIASNALNNVFVDVGGEFSFNTTVGERTEKRGYKKAKIIFNGEFVDGVGGGVCQVSTTLYNALLLADLKIIEYHPHTLPVSYVKPSFDAMVNSGSADLKFVNNTHNPIIIKTNANGQTLKITILGEKLDYKITQASQITEKWPLPEPILKQDLDGEYPDLLKGQQRVIYYGKNGYKSTGSLVYWLNGKVVKQKVIRTDTYKGIKGLTVIGTATLPPPNQNLSPPLDIGQ